MIESVDEIIHLTERQLQNVCGAAVCVLLADD
jgi:hypothetical protein